MYTGFGHCNLKLELDLHNRIGMLHDTLITKKIYFKGR